MAEVFRRSAAAAGAVEEGDEVLALWKSGKKWYRTTVVRANADGTFYLRYEDGDLWEHVPCDRMKLPDGSSLASPAALQAFQCIDRGLKHAVMEGAVDSSYLSEVFSEIKSVFRPQMVKYSNTNPDIKASDGEHGQGIDWKVSSYMEVDTSMGGAMQKGVVVNEALLATCEGLLEACNAAFRLWFERLHGVGSISELVRLQSFVTRYRPLPNENALLRHIDGAHVDGSLILALPTDRCACGVAMRCGCRACTWHSSAHMHIVRLYGFICVIVAVNRSAFTGGGVTVWEGEPETEYVYPMQPGDVCCLDNYVWHQGNPITAGERWSLVIFYAVKRNGQNRILRIVQVLGLVSRACVLGWGVILLRGLIVVSCACACAHDMRAASSSVGAREVKLCRHRCGNLEVWWWGHAGPAAFMARTLLLNKRWCDDRERGQHRGTRHYRG